MMDYKPTRGQMSRGDIPPCFWALGIILFMAGCAGAPKDPLTSGGPGVYSVVLMNIHEPEVAVSISEQVKPWYTGRLYKNQVVVVNLSYNSILIFPIDDNGWAACHLAAGDYLLAAQQKSCQTDLAQTGQSSTSIREIRTLFTVSRNGAAFYAGEVKYAPHGVEILDNREKAQKYHQDNVAKTHPELVVALMKGEMEQ